jgi:hypothetical protein
MQNATQTSGEITVGPSGYTFFPPSSTPAVYNPSATQGSPVTALSSGPAAYGNSTAPVTGSLTTPVAPTSYGTGNAPTATSNGTIASQSPSLAPYTGGASAFEFEYSMGSCLIGLVMAAMFMF